MAKAIHTGLVKDEQTKPPRIWSVFYLTLARDEAMGFLDETQYAHVVDLMQALVEETDPRRPRTVSVDQIEDFYELRDKGGVLGKINLRVFFTVIDGSRSLLVLGAIKKEADGPTPNWVKIRYRNRLRKFREGQYGDLPEAAKE